MTGRLIMQPLFWALCYIFKRSRASDWLFLLTALHPGLHSFSLFLYHKNARNVVQGNPEISKLFPGEHAPGTLYKYVSSLPTRTPPPTTKNPGRISIQILLFRAITPTRQNGVRNRDKAGLLPMLNWNILTSGTVERLVRSFGGQNNCKRTFLFVFRLPFPPTICIQTKSILKLYNI